MDTTQDTVVTADGTLIEQATTGDALKGVLVAGLLMVGVYTTAKAVGRGIVGLHNLRKASKELKKYESRES